MRKLLLTICCFYALAMTAQTVTLYSPNNGGVINGITLSLQWQDVLGETGYIYQLDTVDTFNSTNLQSGTLDAYSGFGFPSVGVGNLNFNTTYYWRIAYVNQETQSEWSAIRYFTTVSQPDLYAPNTTEPININPTLQWYDVSGESGYVVQIDTVSTFDSERLQSETVGAYTNGSGYPSSGVGILAFGTRYYWRVAILNGEQQSNWSLTRSFTTIAQPALYSPVNGETINGILAILQWYDYPAETGYTYQVDTVNTFDSANLVSGTVGEQTSFGFPAVGIGSLAFGTTYYWRVAIMSAAGQSAWSDVRRFTTVTMPNLYFPENRTVNTGSAVNLSWYNIAGETGFAYQVDTNSNFNSSNLQSGTIEAYTSTIGYPAIGLANLLADTTYFWRIAFLNGESQSEWSATWIFSTGGTILKTPGQNEQSFVIYPNPASDRVYIIGNSNKKVQYQLINVNGQELSSGSTQTDAIDISGFQAGVYFLKVVTDNSSGIYKIVKK